MTPAFTSGKCAWRTPSHWPISVETSPWIARSSCGTAARIDRAALPGARAFGRMRDAAARGELLRVVFEGGIAFEHEAQARDPGCPRPGLAVGNALHAPTEQRAHCAEH